MSANTTNDDDLVLELVLRLLGRLTTSIQSREETSFSAEFLAESQREQLKKILADHSLELSEDGSGEKSAALRLLRYALDRQDHRASPHPRASGNVRPEVARAESRQVVCSQDAAFEKHRSKAWIRQALLGCVDPVDGTRFVREVRAVLESWNRRSRATSVPKTPRRSRASLFGNPCVIRCWTGRRSRSST